MRIRISGCGLFLVALALACASVGGLKVSAEPNDDAKVREVVAKYVAATRLWPPSDYAIQRSRTEGKSVVFSVVHKDDEASVSPGGGKSIEVHVDTSTMEVSKELAFQ